MYDRIMLPNNLFIPKDDKDSLIKTIKDDKVILILDYLQNNTNRKDIINFTLEDMIIECGYKPSPKKNENNDQFKNLLVQLQKLKIVECEFELNDIKPKTMYKLKSNLNYDNGFIQLYDKEKQTILNSKIEKIDNLKLLIYYCYLKTRMYKCANGDNVSKDGGRAEVCFPSFKTITQDLGITDKVIEKYNDVLVDLDLIRIGNAGLYYYSNDPNKIVRESCNIYTLYTEQEDYWKTNLKEGIKYYKKLDQNSNKVFTGKTEYKNNNRKLNGELGSIVKKENLGTATEKDLIRKNEILALINENADEMFQIKAWLDNNEGMTLTDIFINLQNYKLTEKYSKIEEKLGLIDEDGDLLVDYEYYKWVMMNYKESKQEYFINCVKKHKEDNKNTNEVEDIRDIFSEDQLRELYPEFNKKSDEKPEDDMISEKISEVSDYIMRVLEKYPSKEQGYKDKFEKVDWTILNETQIDFMFDQVKNFFLTPQEKADIIF